MASYPPVRRGDEGYAMAALLVAMAVMAVMMTAAMPVWHTSAKREKEAELIFRGEQYARAVGLYQRRMGPGTLPPSIDILVDQKFLRKKYKDPITNDDFQLIAAGQGAIGPRGGLRGGGAGALADAQSALQQAAARGGLTVGRGGNTVDVQGGVTFGQGGPAPGGISGVVSKSTDTSLRLYNNRNRYNEWTFVYVQQAQGPGAQRPGEGGARSGQPGRGGRGGVNPFGGRGGAPAAPAGGRGIPPAPAGGRGR